MKHHKVTLQINGKTLTLETGILAQQATSSIWARFGDTMVLSTVVMGEEDVEKDFLPLTVDYVERLYAGGRIKGSRWVKREGRPSDEAILTARLIDRSIRPLFPNNLRRELQVVVTVLSVDGENDPDVLGIVATSAALAVSPIPWFGPIGAVRVGYIKSGREKEGEFVINPDSSELDFLDLDIVASTTTDKTVMIEAEGKQVGEEIALAGVKSAKVWNGKIITMIEELTKVAGEKKIDISQVEGFDSAVSLIEKSYKDEIEKLITGGITRKIGGELDEIVDKVFLLEEDWQQNKKMIREAVDYVFKKTIRERILREGIRPDSRKPGDIREISAQVGVLPRTHGSAIFSRGETQVLTVATLGTPSLSQLIESPEGEEAKRYIHHYAMPPYSVGETGRLVSPTRREIGHGALAERALLPVVPSENTFPYTIRIVSEIMSSNGSTSMAAVCGSTLSLMDTGVPIQDPVAGIAIGLITEGEKGDGKYVILSDIIGLEDFSGDMDFKVAGTKNGITAIQLDVKIDGLTDEIIEKSLAQAKVGRLYILDKMLSVIPEAREKISRFAPKVKVIKVPVEKIGEVIGSGGKTIKSLIAKTGTTIEVEDDGAITISSVDESAVEQAKKLIETLTRTIERGEVFEGTVKRILPFGVMVELVPGKEGLVHVSEMSQEYVESPSDVVKIGQTVKVRVKEIDEQRRINLSMLFGMEGRSKGARPQVSRSGEKRAGHPRDQYTFPRRPSASPRFGRR